jgi:hypothetical protein
MKNRLAVKKYQIGFLICAIVCSCNSGERCMEKMKESTRSMKMAFEQGDSAQLTQDALDVIHYAECVKTNEGMPVAWQTQSNRAKEEAEKDLLHIHCKCYALRLKDAFDKVKAANLEDSQLWQPHYEEWQRRNATTTMTLGDLVSECASEDLTSITSMRAEIESQNAYFLTKDAIGTAQEATENFISTAKGVWKAIEESLDDE